MKKDKGIPWSMILPRILYFRLKKASASMGLSMTAIIITAVTEYLDKKKIFDK